MKDQILDWMLPYLDESGMVQDKPGPGRLSGNSVLRTAEACIVLAESGLLSPSLRAQFARGARMACLEPGLPCRETVGGERENQDSVDNAVGRILIAHLCDAPDLVTDWLAFGRRGFKLPWIPFRIPYYYPNEKQYQTVFGWRAFFWKFLALRCAMEWEAGESPSWLLRMGWTLPVGGTRGGGQDPWILSGLLAEHAKLLGIHHQHEWVKSTVENYEASLKKNFGTRSNMYALYFRENDQAPPNVTHWLVRALKEFGE